MRPKEKIDTVPHRRADFAAKGDRAADVLKPRLVAVKDGVRSGRIEFQRCEALICHLHRDLGRDARVIVGIGLIRVWIDVTAGWVDVGIAAQALMNAPAQKVRNRLILGLAENIPAGHFQAREHAHDAHVRALGEARAIGLAEQQLDLLWISAFELALEHVTRHGAAYFRTKGGVVDFTDTGDAAGRRHPDENEIAPAVAGRRVADDKGFKRLKAHMLLRFDWGRSTAVLQDQICCARGEHHCGGVGVARGDVGKSRGIDHTQPGQAMHAQPPVDD